MIYLCYYIHTTRHYNEMFNDIHSHPSIYSLIGGTPPCFSNNSSAGAGATSLSLLFGFDTASFERLIVLWMKKGVPWQVSFLWKHNTGWTMWKLSWHHAKVYRSRWRTFWCSTWHLPLSFMMINRPFAWLGHFFWKHSNTKSVKTASW